MMTLRRAKERHHDRSRRQEVWQTFYPEDRAGTLAGGFGALQILDEYRLPPGAGIPHRLHRDAEIVTYVREGALAREHSMQAGEFHCMTAGRGLRNGAMNASRTDWAHVFQVRLRPSETGLDPGYEQKRFSSAQRRGGLCVVASPDARKGSLRIHQDALVYSAILDPGQHVVYGLARGRSAWLHLVRGEVALGDVVLTTGDGVGITAERAISLTAREETEILLVDLDEPLPKSFRGGVPHKK